MTTSGLPHCVPVAFVACSMGSLGGISYKQGNFVINMNSRHQYSTTLLKMAYLLGRDLRDL
jgi:hypothetical protein